MKSKILEWVRQNKVKKEKQDWLKNTSYILNAIAFNIDKKKKYTVHVTFYPSYVDVAIPPIEWVASSLLYQDFCNLLLDEVDNILNKTVLYDILVTSSNIYINLTKPNGVYSHSLCIFMAE